MRVVAMRGGYTATGVEGLGADLVLDRLDEIPDRLDGLAPGAA